MGKFSLTLLAAAIGLAASQASAADLPRKAPAYSPPPPPVASWTGCYIGGNVGGAWGNVDATDVNTGVSVSPNNSGFAGGGQIGCDYQMGPWVIGIRNMFDGTSLNKSTALSDPIVGFTGTIDSHVNWFDTLTGRGGYLVQPNLLLYAQGGAAWTQWKLNLSIPRVCKLARSAIAGPAGQSAVVSNGCSCRTGRCSSNTISWASGRAVRPLQAVVLLPVLTSAPKRISRTSWLA